MRTAIALLALTLGACVSNQEAQAPLSLHSAAGAQTVAAAEPATSYTATAIDSLVIPAPVPVEAH